eukprot:TRINITY_DN13954_c2_g1_i1.p1 TRINITY_DN13954_c2_g1~~TRINITY_DN13954_c2_g1_i1.p1  ORF type:complete len:259 (+),score=44.69 TRINITY_DN13954_c2_g1_i1:106-777(+)
MFTLFRCVTDGCVDYDGRPLQESMRLKHGTVFMASYSAMFLFVTVGIFNLIMAVFIDHVCQESTHRELTQLGEDSLLHEAQIIRVIGSFISGRTKPPKSGSLFGRLFVGGLEVEDATSDGANELKAIYAAAVTKQDFNTWLDHSALIHLLEDLNIQTSAKYQLFDVLDADMGGVLQFQELVTGLMKLRGPTTKSDIIDISLKVRYLTEMMEDMRQSFADLAKK